MDKRQATARSLYEKLIALYPRGFREWLGESTLQTFNDLYKEQKHQQRSPALSLPCRLGSLL